MNSSALFKKSQIKKYESEQFNLKLLIEKEEFYKLFLQGNSYKSEKIVKKAEIKHSPTVYLSRIIVSVLESLSSFIVSELSFYKIDKAKYNIYWTFLQSSYVFISIEVKIYAQDETYSTNNPFSAQFLRLAYYFVQLSEVLIDNKQEEMIKSWIGLFDYIEKTINVNISKITKHKEKCSEQYFCLEYIKNVITSFKKSEKYPMNQLEQERLNEITNNIINSKMRDYLLDDDDEPVENNQNQDNFKEIKQDSKIQHVRDIQQSAEFYTIQNHQLPLISIMQSQSNLVSSQILKDRSTSQDNVDQGMVKNDHSQQIPQSEFQSLSQFDSNNNVTLPQNTNQNSSSGIQTNRNREQAPFQIEKDNLSVKTNGSNKTKLVQQILIQQTMNQNNNLPSQPANSVQNLKGKRESILLPSSQFEFQSNIKNGGIGSHLLQNQNNLQENTVNNSYSSQFLGKEDDIFNQNGDNIVITNGVFSRKVSDNLLDDLDQIEKEQNSSVEKSHFSVKKDVTDEELASNIQQSQNTSNQSLHSSFSSTAQKRAPNAEGSNIENPERYVKIERVKEIKMKKNSNDSLQNGRAREFSFKHELIEQKKESKEGSVKTINDIENYISKELVSLNEYIEKIQTENIIGLNDICQQPENLVHPRSSIVTIVGRKSKVRGSNLHSDISAYDLLTSRQEEEHSNSDHDDSESNNSQNSSEQQQQNGFHNRLSRKDRMERYIANGGFNKDEIIMDEFEEEEEEESKSDSSSFGNRPLYTRNRSNVQVQKQILKGRNSHLGDAQMVRSSIYKHEIHTGHQISTIEETLIHNQENQSDGYRINTNSMSSQNQSSRSEEGSPEQFTEYDEPEFVKSLTQEELDQIKQDVLDDMKGINFSLDHTLVGTGIGKNYKKYSFPLVLEQKDNNNFKRRIQEKYKLIQNYQHLLVYDSNIFANDQNKKEQMTKVVVANNKEYLKLMNKLQEDEEEKLLLKRKKKEEIEKKYYQKRMSNKRSPYLEAIFQANRKLEESNSISILPDALMQERKDTQRPRKSKDISIKKNSEQPDFSNLNKRKSQEFVFYNSHQDEIEEDDRFFHDETDSQGFSHQLFAINKHNYFKDFKEQVNEDILKELDVTIDTFSKELKEEEQKERSDNKYRQDQMLFDLKKVEDYRMPAYSLALDINDKFIKQPIQQLFSGQPFPWNRVRQANEEKKQLEYKPVSPAQQPLKFKKSVIINEDQLNEIYLRQKNYSSSPSKKQQQNNLRKARKRSGSFNPEANFPQEQDNEFSSTIQKFQQLHLNLKKNYNADKQRYSLLQ